MDASEFAADLAHLVWYLTGEMIVYLLGLLILFVVVLAVRDGLGRDRHN